MVGGRVARIVTTIVTLAILARLISPAEFGVVAAAGLADTFVLVVTSNWLGIALLRPPRPPRAWDGVKDATAFGPKPPQSAYPPMVAPLIPPSKHGGRPHPSFIYRFP